MSFRGGAWICKFGFMELVRVVEMLKEMHRRDRNGEPVPFSITFVTCDLKRFSGGEKVTLEKAVLVGGPSKSNKVRDPKHGVNFTRNIKSAEGDRIMKIRPLLVTRFNGKRVTQ